MMMMNQTLRRCSLVLAARSSGATRCFTNTAVVEREPRQSSAEKNRAAVMEAYMTSMNNQQEPEAPVVDETRGDAWRVQEREILTEEAAYLAKSLYRTCLRSVSTLRPGNERDEKDFKEREDKQFAELEEDGGDILFSMEPPVNRANELNSRADYYYTHLRENYSSDSQCLLRDPWKEQHIESFLNYVRQGEKRRRYVLKDYGFKDPYKGAFDADRIKKFEARANELLRDTYKAHGWLLMADVKPEDYATGEYDPEFDFDDDPADKLPKL